jgi:hypothetical protein
MGRRALAPNTSSHKLEVLDLAEANGANHTYTANVTAMSQMDEFQVTALRISQPRFPLLLLKAQEALDCGNSIPNLEKFLHG